MANQLKQNEPAVRQAKKAFKEDKRQHDKMGDNQDLRNKKSGNQNNNTAGAMGSGQRQDDN